MSANDLLSILLQLSFVLVAFLTVTDYLLHRDGTRRDIALWFGSLGLPYVLEIFSKADGPFSITFERLAWISLMAAPYLLLRLVQYFRTVPSRLMRAALAGMLFSWGAFTFASWMSNAVQVVAVLLILVYLVVIDGYAMVAFVRDTRTTYGLIRQRLRYAAAGSAFLTLTFLALGFQVFVPLLAELFTFLLLVAAIAAAFSFYLAFTPPRWLRRAWQSEELRLFLLQTNVKTAGERSNAQETLHELCRSAMRAVGGRAAAMANRDPDSSNRWLLSAPDLPAESAHTYESGDGILQKAGNQAEIILVRQSSTLNPVDQALMRSFSAEIMFVCPVKTAERDWGLLLVFQRRPSLFIQDDLDLLTLIIQQSTVFLENASLVEVLHHHSEDLEKRVEERTHELEESQIEYRRIIETSQEGVWLTSADNRTLFANKRMAEILGCTVEEMMPVSTLDFVDEDQIALIREARKRRSNGVKEQYELKFRRRGDGAEIYTLVAATPLVDDEGKTIGSLAMVADITERKLAEMEILKLNADLEQRVAERTAELSIANREMEAFSYSVSHDLRAPLRAMDGFGQALLEDYGDKLDEDGVNFIQRIRDNSQRMGQLIDALLKLSKLSRAEMQIKQVSLSKLAQAIQQDLCEQYPDRKVEFVIADGIEVMGDEGLLRVALTNLLNNACKFSSKQPNPCVEFGKMQQHGRPVYFVRDNGVGFDMAHAHHLFSAFQRLHSSKDFEGTGIGLATVERIIVRHKGKIWVEAAVNEGATFYFMI